MKRTLLAAVMFLCPWAAGHALGAETSFQNEYLRWSIGSDARVLRFLDKQANTDHLDRTAAHAIAHLKKGGKVFFASAATWDAGRLTLQFGESGVTAVLDVRTKPRYLVLEVVSVSDPSAEALTFVDMALTLKGSPDEPFGACALALNLQTNVEELPGFNRRIRATCYPRFGMAGAKAALIGCPSDRLRDLIKEAVTDAPDLPHSPLGGPWALDAPINQGSYIFNFGDMSEQTVDDWIRLAKTVGMNQIDFHGGNSFRFGDLRPNPQTYPNGRTSLKAVIDRLHAAGLQAGLHTYAFFLAKDSEWVSPKPDPRLGKDKTFTLAGDLTADAAAVPVIETTEKMTTITGFFEWNSVTLQIDDELITYADIDKKPPYAFTKCARGAWGAKVHHLKECFGLFVPDGDSTLLAEVAARTASMFNECGFDMMYLDALDGEGILGGPEAGWHYGSKFVFEIWKRLTRPALMEMSTFHHHLWYVRSRYCAWDHPSRAHKKFIDIHVAANNDNRRIFMPGHLGWWAVKTWEGSHMEPTYADDIEYLGCKCVGTDTGFSVMGVDPSTIDKVPALRRLAGIMRSYEELRHARTVPESVKSKLRKRGREYTLIQKPDGRPAFRQVHTTRHKVEGADGRSDTWKVRNPYAPQPLRVRIEALCGIGPYGAEGNPTIAEFRDAGEFAPGIHAPGMAMDIRPATDVVKAGGTSGRITATNRASPAEPGRTPPSWAVCEKKFSPPLDLSRHPALAIRVHGDAKGEVLNVQLRSPEHVSRGIRDHYIVVDFTGWRCFGLLEPESDRCDHYSWPYGGNAYAQYREIVDSRSVGSLSLWINNVPPGDSVTLHVSPVRAVSAFDAKLTHPAITIGGKTVRIPATIETGCYLELRSPSDCKLYGRPGQLLAEVTPDGPIPLLHAGDNLLEFRTATNQNIGPRARITVFCEGELLEWE